MPEYSRLQNNFSAGYVDPTLHGLTNTQIFAQGLMQCRNYIPSALGYLYRRPGTSFTGWSRTYESASGKPVRLCAIKSENGPQVVIFMDHEVEIRREGGFGNVYNLHDGDEVLPGRFASVPWNGADLKDLDIYEFQGSLYVLHRDYPPHVLEGLDKTGWDLVAEELSEAPYSASGEYEETLFSDLYASGGFACFRMEFEDGKFSSANEYPSCQTFKGGRWYLAGTRNNPATIYASKAPDVRGRYRFSDFRLGEYYLLAVTSVYRKITVYKTSEADGEIEKVYYESESQSEVTDRNVLSDVSDILDYEVPQDDHSDVTVRYRRNPGTYDEYSETEDPAETKKVVVTTTSVTYSLKSDVEADDGIELTESDMFGSSVNWLLTQQRVIAGTDRSIWMDTGVAATPSTFDMVQTLASTVSPVHPVQYGSAIIFVPGDRRSVKAFSYDDNAGGYTLQDISATARTLFTSEVSEMALCEGRETILWLLLSNGRLLSCTMGSTYGWAEHEIGGSGFVRSIVPYHGDDGSSCIYLAVDRRQGNSHRQTIERLDLEDLVQTKVFRLMDCQVDARTMADDGTLDMARLSERFEGMLADSTHMPYVLHDGWPYPLGPDGAYAPGIVSSGDSGDSHQVSIGYGYVSRVEMLWQDLPTNSQTSLGLMRRAVSILLQLYRSGNPYGGYRTIQRERLERLPRLAKGNARQTDRPELYTGLVKIPVPSNTDEMVHAVIQAEEPLPMTVLAIETKYSIQEI